MEGRSSTLEELVQVMLYGSGHERWAFEAVYPRQWAERSRDVYRVRAEVIATSPGVHASVHYLRLLRGVPAREVRIHVMSDQRVESDGLALQVEMTSVAVGNGLWRHAIDVCNVTPFAGDDRDAAMDRSLAALHLVLRGSFVSSIDPPEYAANAVAACRCTGLYPVLVGEGAMLASPLPLPDHPGVDDILRVRTPQSVS